MKSGGLHQRTRRLQCAYNIYLVCIYDARRSNNHNCRGVRTNTNGNASMVIRSKIIAICALWAIKICNDDINFRATRQTSSPHDDQQ